jgi:LacI family transcriptional regulator, galactose operon repressor
MRSHAQEGASRRTTLVDVARDAGVSRATASLVLRDSPLVAEATRARVLASMHKLGYVVNRAAASLRTRRSQTIGLIVTGLGNPFFAQMTVGSEAEVGEANYALLLSTTADRADRQSRMLEAMQAYGVDGILLCPAKGTAPETVARLRRWRLPFVLVTRYLDGVDADYVGADNVLGAALAVDHLVAGGHRRIALVGGPADSSARRDRRRGYRVALARHGLTADDTLSIASPVTRDGGHRAMLALLQHHDPPTAALCYNDVVALGAMLALQAAGLAPGQDMAVVGFDDIEEASLWRPALTTVSIPPGQIGARAAALLLERIADPDGAPRQVILAPTLVVRDSSGPLRAGERREGRSMPGGRDG